MMNYFDLYRLKVFFSIPDKFSKIFLAISSESLTFAKIL